MSLASINTAAEILYTELQTKQAAAFAKNGKYAQLFASHDVTPSVAIAPKTKVDMLRDEDIFPTLPATMNFAFRVDETIHPEDEYGWILLVWAIDSGTIYQKAWADCPDSGLYPSDWTPTDIEPGD